MLYDLTFATFVVHITKIYSQSFIFGILWQSFRIFLNNLQSSSFFFTNMDSSLSLMSINIVIYYYCSIFLFIEIIIVLLVIQNDFLEIVILVFRRILYLSIWSIIVIKLIVPSSLFIEHINVIWPFNSKSFSIRQLSKHLKSRWVRQCFIFLHSWNY